MASDRDLLWRSAHRDRDAFAQLFDRHANTVFRYGFGLTGDANDAQDLVQDAFLIAWRRSPEIDLMGDSILPWLLVCVRNLAANLRRRNAVRVSAPLETALEKSSDEPDMLEAIENTLELEWVFNEIAALGDIDRRIAELCLYDGVSYAEAAAQLGLSVGALAKRIQRIRDRLRMRRAGDGRS